MITYLEWLGISLVTGVVVVFFIVFIMAVMVTYKDRKSGKANND